MRQDRTPLWNLFVFRIFEIQYFEKLSTDLGFLFLVLLGKVISTSYVRHFFNEIKIVDIVIEQIFVFLDCGTATGRCNHLKQKVEED